MGVIATVRPAKPLFDNGRACNRELENYRDKTRSFENFAGIRQGLHG
jgi:hypothetical protein